MLKAMDISPYNANTDLAAEKARGLGLVRIKLSEGTYGSYAPTRGWWDQAGQLNLKRGLYHFAMCGLSGPIPEAHFFLGVLAGQGIVLKAGDTIHLDYEEDGNVGATSPSEWALTWLDEVGRALGAAPAFPGIYCDRYRATQVLTDARLGAYSCWLAAWTTAANVPNDTWPASSEAPSLSGTPFKDMDLWQWSASSYTSFPTAVIPGAGLDLDVSFLDVAGYAKYGKKDPQPQQQYKVTTEQWLRSEPDAASTRLIDMPVGSITTNYGAPTPHWLNVTFNGIHGWLLRSNAVPI